MKGFKILGLVLAVSLWAIPSWAVSGDTEILRVRLHGPRAGAHQGGLFGFKFNTIKAFKKALRRGADVIEFDLRLSKDGIPMVYHDETMGLWTWCGGKLRDRTAEEIQDCHFKLNFQKIPTFEEVLQWNHGQIVMSVEPKELEVIEPALKLMQKYQANSWGYMHAKGWDKYEWIRSLDKKVPLLFPIKSAEDLDRLVSLQDENLLVIEVHQVTRNAEIFKKVHDARMLVSEDSWHLSRVQEFFGATCKKAFEIGIDIAVSNRPVSCARQRDDFISEHLNGKLLDPEPPQDPAP